MLAMEINNSLAIISDNPLNKYFSIKIYVYDLGINFFTETICIHFTRLFPINCHWSGLFLKMRLPRCLGRLKKRVYFLIARCFCFCFLHCCLRKKQFSKYVCVEWSVHFFIEVYNACILRSQQLYLCLNHRKASWHSRHTLLKTRESKQASHEELDSFVWNGIQSCSEQMQTPDEATVTW